MKLSIIIPVYQTQDTIDRCIESILQQSFTDYEIILVDDGSDDECSLLCDNYSQKDRRITTIHKKNGGLSDARNTGIKHSKGKYITFIDSDDAIQNYTLQALMDEINKYPETDVLEYPIMERIGHPYKEQLLAFTPRNYNNCWEYWLNEQGYLHTYACNKIFRRCLFKNVYFPKGKTFEDVQTIPFLIGLIPTEGTFQQKVKIRVTNKGCYLYYWNNKGITASAKYEDLLSLYIGQSMALIHTFKTIGNRDDIMQKYQLSINIYLTQILNVLMDLFEVSGKYENCAPLIKYTKLINNKGLINSLKLKLLLIIGYKRLCKLNRLIHKIYRHH